MQFGMLAIAYELMMSVNTSAFKVDKATEFFGQTVRHIEVFCLFFGPSSCVMLVGFKGVGYERVMAG